jgi:2-polyprenyl-3-methyl-5-hydroxy-6-metoxy-1,4-benzoquinol methylase
MISLPLAYREEGVKKQALEELYQQHHDRGSRYGYLFCGGARGPYLNAWIGQGKRVLDLGCRDGALTSFFSGGNEVLGADIDRYALGVAKNRLGIDTLWVDLNTEWPFEPHSFDVVVACEILEHLFFIDEMLEKIARTLKPQGLFIGSVPNSFRLRNRLKFLMGKEFDNDPTHVRRFSSLTLQSKLSPFFSDIEITPIQGAILPYVPVTQKWPRAIQRLFGKDLLWRSRVVPQVSQASTYACQ